jgi:hypothetical protein
MVEIMSIHVKSKNLIYLIYYLFIYLNRRFEVHENKVEFNLSDHFQVKMTSRVDNFTLDHCRCRISIRKEGRGGRYEKIGYYDLDLASVAGSGDESKACLLYGYQQTNSSPANAYLEIRMKLTVLEGDHIFRRFVFILLKINKNFCLFLKTR